MLDVHALHESIHTWKSFFIHIATIVVGLCIAVVLEQSVEVLRRHHESRTARAAIESEVQKNLQSTKENQQRLVEQQNQLQQDLQTLDSTSPDVEAIPALKYKWILEKVDNSAWSGAKINGSLALISPADIAQATYFYESEDALDPVAYSYFTDMDSGSALVDHARSMGKLTPAVHQQLLALTTSALGRNRTLLTLLGYERHALEATRLEKE